MSEPSQHTHWSPNGVPVSRLLMLLAFVFFLVATLIAGGVINSSSDWWLPAGLTSLALAFLL